MIDIDRGQNKAVDSTVFVDHNLKNTDLITYYNIQSDVEKDYDLTEFIDYPKIGFHPTDIPKNTMNKFFGTERKTSYVKNNPLDPDTDCMGVSQCQFYVLWLSVGDSWTEIEHHVPCP